MRLHFANGIISYQLDALLLLLLLTKSYRGYQRFLSMFLQISLTYLLPIVGFKNCTFINLAYANWVFLLQKIYQTSSKVSFSSGQRFCMRLPCRANSRLFLTDTSQ